MLLRLLATCILALLISTPLFADVMGTGPGATIPDNGSVISIITIGANENETISNLSVTIDDFEHSFIGDLIVTLSHVDTGTIMPLFNRVQRFPSSGNGDSSNLSGTYRFADNTADLWLESGNGDSNYNIPDIQTQSYSATNVGGSPVGFADNFAGESTVGTWRLAFADSDVNELGSFGGWQIQFESQAIPEPVSFAFSGLVAIGLTCRRRRV